MTRAYEYTIAHFFCGIGGGGLGSAEARAELAGFAARFRVLGGVGQVGGLGQLVASDTNTFRLSAHEMWASRSEEGAVIV